jgi:hypothetical protein
MKAGVALRRQPRLHDKFVRSGGRSPELVLPALLASGEGRLLIADCRHAFARLRGQ